MNRAEKEEPLPDEKCNTRDGDLGEERREEGGKKKKRSRDRGIRETKESRIGRSSPQRERSGKKKKKKERRRRKKAKRSGTKVNTNEND